MPENIDVIIRKIIFVCCMMGCTDGFCQVKEYPFSKLAIQDGLSDNGVNAIFKDRQGYSWFGTRSGLNRYDGYGVKVFRHDDADPASLKDDSTGTGGINIYDPQTDGFIPHVDDYLRTQHLLQYGLVSILHDRGHYYFIYGDSGIYRIDPGKVAIPVGGDMHASPAMSSRIYGATLDQSGNKVSLLTDIMQHTIPRASSGYKLFIDGKDQLWLYALVNLS